MLAKPALDVRPLRIRGDGIVVSGADWEQYSFANPGVSIAEFLRWSGPCGSIATPYACVGSFSLFGNDLMRLLPSFEMAVCSILRDGYLRSVPSFEMAFCTAV